MLVRVLEITRPGGDGKPCPAKTRKAEVGRGPMPLFATQARRGFPLSPQGARDGLIYLQDAA